MSHSDHDDDDALSRISDVWRQRTTRWRDSDRQRQAGAKVSTRAPGDATSFMLAKILSRYEMKASLRVAGAQEWTRS